MSEVQEVEGAMDSSGDGLEIHSPKMDSSVVLRPSPMFSLKWNGFDNQVTASLASLYASEELADVTLICDDGKAIKAHKVILAMTSQFFRQIFKEAPSKHPVVILKDMNYKDVQHVMQFVYKGEVRVREEEIDSFIEAAESLRIDGINSSHGHDNDNLGDVNMKDDVGASNDKKSEPIGDSPELAHALSSHYPSWNVMSPKSMDTGSGSLKEKDIEHKILHREMVIPGGNSKSRYPSSTSLAPPSSSSSSVSAPTVQLVNNVSDLTPFHHPQPCLTRIHARSSSNSNESTVSDLSCGSRSPSLNLAQSRNNVPTRDHESLIENSGRNGSRHFDEAEDLSKSSEQSYELSLPESGRILARTLTGSSARASFPSYSNQKRSTSWSIDDRTHTYSSMTRQTSTPYLPLSLVAASAITSRASQNFRNLTRPITVPSSTHTHNHHSTARAAIGHFGRVHDPHSATATLSALKERLTASASALPAPPFVRLQAGTYSIKSTPVTNYSPSERGPQGVKPKTKAIRSSQVPQSARYTAAEVDAMVDQVEKFPGPLVPCVVCQKFVKRERLRAHIHECHLLHGERIICQHCGIGLKSKGSFRVHIWRHKRGNLSVKPPNDP